MKISDICKNPPVGSFSVDEMAKICPRVIAEDLASLYNLTDGIDIYVDDCEMFDSIVIDELDYIFDEGNRSSSEECFPGLFRIGSDGAGQVIAYDLDREPNFPIVIHCPGEHVRGKAPILANNMTDFIQTYVTGA